MINKYGTIDAYGVSAQWVLVDDATNQDALAEIAAPNGKKDSHGIPAEVSLIEGTPTVTINGQPVAQLPTDWSRFMGQLKKRGAIAGKATINHRADRQGLRLVFTLTNA